MNGELIYLTCIQGCETYADRDEYYANKMAENEMRCGAHGEVYQPALNLTED